jgi:hypothetical protein
MCPWYIVGGKMSEQRINIKFSAKFGKSDSETSLLRLAYGEYAMKKSSVVEWHRRFKEGQDVQDVQDDPRSGQPKIQRTDANVDRIQTNADLTVLFGSAHKVIEICLEEKTRTLA